MTDKYLYTLAQPYRFYFDNWIYQKGQMFIADWLKITDLTIEIPQGYSWDGCSPKLKFLNGFIGTPDFGTKTYHASLVHDALYQYSAQHGLPRKLCDEIFLVLMLGEDFKLARLYHKMVRMFGWMFWKNP